MNRITRLSTGLAAAALAAVPSSAHAQRNRDLTRIDSTFAFEKGSWVDVSVASGEVVVTGWTRPEAKVYASIERGWIDAQLSSSRITLQTRSDHGRSGPTRIEIMVPIGTRVQTSSASASIRITGTDGEVEAGSASGAIEVLGASDRITVHTVSGKVHAAKLRGRTRLGTTSGTVEAEDVSGDLNVGTVSGRITLSGVKSSHVSAESVSSSVTYAGSIDPAGSYELSTHSGNVHLEIPDNSAADLSLETFSGRISSAFPITLQPGDISAMARHGKKMEFMIGKGGARIYASTFSGNITIDRGGHMDREEELMRRKISTLAMMLGAAVPLLTACSSARAYAQTRKSSDEPFTWSGAVQSGRWVYVRNLNGSVRVEEGTGNKVEVRAEKRWRRGDPEDVKITVRQVGSGQGDLLVCALWNDRSSCDEDGYHSHNDGWWHNDRNDVSVEFVVRLPAGVKIDASTVNGGVDVDGATSTVVTHAVNGSIEARSSGGSVSARTTNGDITVRSASLDGEHTEFSTTNGSVTVELPASVNADVDMRTVNGRLSSDFPLTIEGSFSPRRLHATLGKGGPTLRLSTVNGSIRLRKLS